MIGAKGDVLSKTSEESGHICLSDSGIILYQSQVYGRFEVPLDGVRIIGEMTNENGPFTDDYFLCLALDRTSWYEVSMYAKGIEVFLKTLQARLDTTFDSRLYSSTTFASRVLWPTSLAGQEMFQFTHQPGVGWRKWLPSFKNVQTFAQPIQQYLHSD